MFKWFLKLVFVVVCVAVTAAIFYGFAPTRAAIPSPTPSPAKRKRRGWGWLAGIAAAVLIVAGLTLLPRGVPRFGGWWTRSTNAAKPATGDLWLSDFETVHEELIRWTTDSATVSQTTEHATHGISAAEVRFEQAQSPSFGMDAYLARDKRRRDWRGYDRLAFDLYNPQPSSIRLLLQLRSFDGKLYKEEFVIPAHTAQHGAVDLRQAGAFVDLSYLVELRFFQWNPRQPATFILDAVRLEAPRDRLPSAGPSASITAPEPGPRPTPITPTTAWQLAWSSSLTKLLRDPAQFMGHREGPVRLALARGEYESVQLALIGGAQPERVAVTIGPLTHAGSAAGFPKAFIEIRRVDYVRTTKPFYPVTFVGDWPDPLPLANTAEVPAGIVQPMWITVGAPDTQPAGRYDGTITVTDGTGRTETLPLEVTVWDVTLPRTPHLKTAFDFYRGRLERAYQEFVPDGRAWQDRLDELEDRYRLNLLKHRLSPVWNADPTKPQFAWDVKRYLDRGLTAFGVGSRGGSFGNNWPSDPVELARAMVWYRQAAFELGLMDLLREAYVYAYDEPAPGDAQVTSVLEALHHEASGLKTLLVLREPPDPVRHAEWLKPVDILCLRLSSVDPAQAAAFQSMGKELWLYVASPSPPFPSFVIDAPAIEQRIVPWMAWKVGASGLLYWCVNFWDGDPLQHPDSFAKGQNGNGFLYYPGSDGPIPSIRLAVIRDGVEDYEYLARLRELVQAAKTRGVVEPALLARAERLLAVDPTLVESLRTYTRNPEVLLAQRQAIAETIETLQHVTGGTTSPSAVGD